ncbi:MAG TPA: hypothetical protein VGY76_05480 [Solirubrobacteraceae bacterium]|jgi:hypothetical protein|nr:hypothetical protein [Solirubrobacteraceae bacterium]
MQRITVHGLSAMSLAALALFATTVGSAAGSPGRVGKAAKRSARHRAKHPVPAGVVFGGVTSAQAPVVIEVSRNGREVAQAIMAVPVQCQMSDQASKPTLFLPVAYTHLPISPTGAFHEGNEKTESEAGHTTTVTGRLSGGFNRARTSVTGTWSLVVVIHDATGATVGRCDSGAVSFTAIQ